MSRVYNFSPGPSMLPEEVLRQCADEMLDYNGTGMSVVEMSHRSKPFEEIIFGAEALLREIMGIPANYKVLFLQGGASTQFAMVPMNLMVTGKADYIVTGSFAKKAYDEAKKFGTPSVAASSKEKNHTYIPRQGELNLDPAADYAHICHNNTIYGTKYDYIPDTGDVLLVSDMSSCILSEPVDVSKFGLIYAGAQKNIAPAGLTVVIVREDLIGRAGEKVPTMMNYKTFADERSLYNTPPCFSIHVCKLVMEWVKKQGGLTAMKKRNQQKAGLLYDYLDKSAMFTPCVRPDSRSMMNVTYVMKDEEAAERFCKEAAKVGLATLKGHRSVGGIRANLYNAMPVEGVQALVDFMGDFEKKNS